MVAANDDGAGPGGRQVRIAAVVVVALIIDGLDIQLQHVREAV